MDLSRNQTCGYIEWPVKVRNSKSPCIQNLRTWLRYLISMIFQSIENTIKLSTRIFFRKSHFLLTLSYFWWWLLLSNLDEMSNSWRKFQNFCLRGAFQRDFVNEESAARRFQHTAQISNFHLIWWRGWTNQSCYARTYPA